jgi:hypothetical protein
MLPTKETNTPIHETKDVYLVSDVNEDKNKRSSNKTGWENKGGIF